MAATAGGGRRRTQSNTTEDHALNMIAREAEARLAAKRAARAEARSIRMKELERMQREADEKMDKQYQRSLLNGEAIKKRIQAHLTSAPATPASEPEINGPVVPENQLKSLQENVQDLEHKYRNAMVNIAQLDNERQALTYQVDCLKERLEDEEEIAENLRDELSQRNKEYSRLSYENKKNVEEIERLHLMLAERDRILEEHSINLEEELMGITTTPDGLSPRTNESVNLDSVEIDHSGSSGGGKSRGSSRRSSVPDDKEILLEQIRTLKEEVSELRRENESEVNRMKDIAMEDVKTCSGEPSTKEGGRCETNDLECSTFVDVTEEAEGIDEDEQPAGLVINNNEKNEDFEVIDNNVNRPGGIANFEDRSYEGVSKSSVATGSLDSLEVTESVESEIPLEISVGATNESNVMNLSVGCDVESTTQTVPKEATKEYTDYDIVEDSEVKNPVSGEEGGRVRSRYYSFPKEDDDGFETPPETEDDLRKDSDLQTAIDVVAERGEDSALTDDGLATETLPGTQTTDSSVPEEQIIVAAGGPMSSSPDETIHVSLDEAQMNVAYSNAGEAGSTEDHQSVELVRDEHCTVNCVSADEDCVAGDSNVSSERPVVDGSDLTSIELRPEDRFSTDQHSYHSESSKHELDNHLPADLARQESAEPLEHGCNLQTEETTNDVATESIQSSTDLDQQKSADLVEDDCGLQDKETPADVREESEAISTSEFATVKESAEECQLESFDSSTATSRDEEQTMEYQAFADGGKTQQLLQAKIEHVPVEAATGTISSECIPEDAIPVPKERKKKKNKNKKAKSGSGIGSQELLREQGSIGEATKSEVTEETKPLSIAAEEAKEQSASEQAVSTTISVESNEGETPEKKTRDDAIEEDASSESLMESDTNDIRGDQQVDLSSECDDASISADGAYGEQKQGEASDQSGDDAHTATKERKKRSRKSKKDQKKEGCKSQ